MDVFGYLQFQRTVRWSGTRAGLLLDSAGNLYGTAFQGGGSCYCGVVFEVSPAAGGWTYRVLHTFTGDNDGEWPQSASSWTQPGIYMEPQQVELRAKAQSSKCRLRATTGISAHSTLFPTSGVRAVLGRKVRCFLTQPELSTGTTYATGSNFLGSVFKLTPTNGGWVFSSLHDFSGYDGEFPLGNLLMDSSGNIYGTTNGGGANGLGTVWEFTP